MDAMDIIPGPLMNEIIKKMIRKQGEMDVREKIRDITSGCGAQGRSIRLVVRGVGTYNFTLTNDQIKYVDELKDPTTIADMTDDVFLDIFKYKYTPMTAWKHNLLKFQVNDGKLLYHITLLTALLAEMRKIMGM